MPSTGAAASIDAYNNKSTAHHSAEHSTATAPVGSARAAAVNTPFKQEIIGGERIVKQGSIHNSTQSIQVKNALIDGVQEEKASFEAKIPEYCLRLQKLEEVISEFSTDFPEHLPANSRRVHSGEVILLTGSTGALGSELLAYLASAPVVSHIFAFNRCSGDPSKTLQKRQAETFMEHDLDINILQSPKVTLVEGDTTVADLGIDSDLFNEIRDNITLIIHNAWRVNFLAELGFFKPSIRGVRTLIDLALGSPHERPPRIIFTSSKSVFKNWNAERGRPLEVPISDPAVALGSGYSEAKFAAERVLEIAANSTPLRPIIVRIGQLAGPPNGAWNPNEWPAGIVRAGLFVGALPARDDCVAWLPLVVAAEAIFDFRNSELQYFHLEHPDPAPWNSVFSVFSSRMNVPLIPWDQWQDRVERSFSKHWAFPIFDIFNECCYPVAMENREGPGITLMDLRQALESSPTLSHPSLPQVSPEDAERWFRYWRKTGVLYHTDAKL